MKRYSRFYLTAMTIGLLSTAVINKSYSQKTSSQFTINGEIAGHADGKKVYLQSTQGAAKKLDSTIIKGGAFQFTGHLNSPEVMDIVILKNDTPTSPNRPLFQPVIPVFVEHSKIEIKAVLDSIPTQDYIYYGKGYSYNTVRISGSASNDLYLRYLSKYKPLSATRSEIFDEYIDYLNPGKGKQKGKVSEGIAIVSRMDQATERRNRYVKDFIKKYPDNIVTLRVASDNLSSFSVKEVDQLLGSLSPIIRSTTAGAALKAKAMEVKKTATGANYADFAFHDDKDNPVKFSDYLGKGKYTLIDFWASWCGPCRADLPHLKEVYAMYHGAGFEVISVSLDDDKAKWLKAIEEEKMPWLQVSDLKAFKGDLSKLYNFNGIPTCVLIGPDGKIVTRNMRGSWMDKKLIELYGNKFGDQY